MLWFFNHSIMSSYLQPHKLQHTRLPCPSLHPRISSNLCPSSNDAIQPSHYLSSHLWPSILPSTRDFFSEFALQIRSRKYWGFSFSISLSDEYSGLISFRMDSQGSSPAPQFKSINSSAVSFLCTPTHIHIWLLEKP